MGWKATYAKSAMAAGLSLLLAAGPAFGAAGTASAGLYASGADSSAYRDIKGHWAEQRLAEWAAAGWLSGYGNGELRPDQHISRSEFAALVNRAFALQGTAQLSFKDVKPQAWDYATVSTAVYAGYASGYEDGTFRPAGQVTRQEAAVMLGKASGVETASAAEPAFRDSAKLGAWSRPFVAALAAQGVLGGYPDGSFRPAGRLTRAEAVTAIGKAAEARSGAASYAKAGVYGPASGQNEIKGDVRVEAGGVSLRNLHVRGDLIVTEAVGEGDVNLSGIQVDGKTIVRGGGVRSIHILNSNLGHVIVEKTSPVRLSLEGTSRLGTVIVSQQSSGSVVALGADSRIDVLQLEGKTFVSGQGTVSQAKLAEAAKDSVFEKEPGSKTLPTPSVSPSPTPAPGGGGGFFPGFPGLPGNPSPTASPTISPTASPSATPTATPTATPATGDFLTSLSIGSYPLVQFVSGKSGFDPEVMEYDLILPVDYAAGQIELTAATNVSGAKIRLLVRDEFMETLADWKDFVGGKSSYLQNAREKTNLSVSLETADGEFLSGYSIRVLYEPALAEKTRATINGEIIVEKVPKGATVRTYRSESDAQPYSEITQLEDGRGIGMKPFVGIDMDVLKGQKGQFWISIQYPSQPEQPRQKVEYDFSPLAKTSGGLKGRSLTAAEMEAVYGSSITYNVQLLRDPSSELPSGAVYVKTRWWDSYEPYLERPYISMEDAKQEMLGPSVLSKLEKANPYLDDFIGWKGDDFTGAFKVFYYDKDRKPIGYDFLPVNVKVNLTSAQVMHAISRLSVPVQLKDIQPVYEALALYDRLSAEEQKKVANYSVLQAALAELDRLSQQSGNSDKLNSLALSGARLDRPFDKTYSNYSATAALGYEQKEAVLNLDYDENISEVSVWVQGMHDLFVPVEGKSFRFRFPPQMQQWLLVKVKSKINANERAYALSVKGEQSVYLSAQEGIVTGLEKGDALHVYAAKEDVDAYDVARLADPNSETPYGPMLAQFRYPVSSSQRGSIWLAVEKNGVLGERMEKQYDFRPLQEVTLDQPLTAVSNEFMVNAANAFAGIRGFFSFTDFKLNSAALAPSVRYVALEPSLTEYTPTHQHALQAGRRMTTAGNPLLDSKAGEDIAPTVQQAVLYLYDADYRPIGFVRYYYMPTVIVISAAVRSAISQIRLNDDRAVLQLNVERARKAYDLLAEDSKQEVYNYAFLQAAEAYLKQPN
ncbi:S-layer homology domain-containing protein [Paenibacillus sp. B01]|uniref:S-layer homology domain-containing protein n=1 Tax=Paenibacillus sp. B01 TaxID=2660554 RepID=UPI001891253F|nr:S-layer homology domain-containing protein [Paenibacillus sp. B01]